MKAIIIDDEPSARKLLATILQEYCADIELVAKESNVPDAVLSIKKHQPDVVFLDIDMPVYNGFQLFSFFEKIDFKVIFTTAHSEFAVKAFRYAAVDYLLKPINAEEVIEAVEKLKEQTLFPTKEYFTEVNKSIEQKVIQKIAISSSKGFELIDKLNILYLEADGRYTIFHLENGEKKMATKTLKEFDNFLSKEEFIRTHRSYLVALDKITEVSNEDGGIVILKNKARLSINKEAKNFVEQQFGVK